MDIIFDFTADSLGFDKTSLATQAGLFYVILGFGGTFFYVFTAALSYAYWFWWKKKTYFPPTIKPSDIPKQVAHEIFMGVTSIPLIAVAMFPAAVFSYRGYSRIYHNVDDYGWPYLVFSVVIFFLLTDCMVYWAHRGLHHPLIYRRIHKPHHTYRYTTPFSSHAFHPIDGFGQGAPYYIAIFIIPMHNIVFMMAFVTINCWTVMIHDQVDFGQTRVINSTGHHTIHHVDFNYNYGQYLTLWDRIGGTYKPAVKTHDLPRSICEALSPDQ